MMIQLTFSSLIKFSFILFLFLKVSCMWENEAKNVSKGKKRPQFSWQTVNPPVPHSSPYNIKALRLNYELTNYVLTSKTRVTDRKERENSRLKMITWKKSHKKSKNSHRVCARHCSLFPKKSSSSYKEQLLDQVVLDKDISYIGFVNYCNTCPKRPAAVKILNGLKLKFVSHLISNKVPPAHLFSKPASEWFWENLFLWMNETKNHQFAFFRYIFEHTLTIVNIIPYR